MFWGFESFDYLCYIMMETNGFKQTVMLIDGDYVDSVAFDLTVNFERMLMRRIRPVDMAQWLVCMALDGGVGECPAGTSQEVQVIFLHGQDKRRLEQFVPCDLAKDIDGKAFRDERLGEFLMSAVKKEGMAGEDFFVECAEALLGSREVKTVILIPDMAKYGTRLKDMIADESKKTEKENRKDITLLAMQPEAGRGFQSEILGYSLMHAMGIKGEELRVEN